MKLLLEIKKYRIVLLFLLVLTISCKEQIKKENIKVVETSRVDYLPFYQDESFTPHWLTPGSKEEKSFHKIPDFKLLNQLGDTISQSTFENKIYITDFFFTTCPGICPQMTDNMAKIQEEFKEDDDILLLSHSVMPNTDTVSALKNYANNNNVIDNKWHLVTGDIDQIYNIARASYFADEDFKKTKDESEFIHTENFVLVDGKGRIRGVYNGTLGVDILRLKRHVKILKKEL